MEIKPIAYIKTDFKEKFGIPRQSGRVNSLKAKIVFTPEFRDPNALREIENFSHIWLIFDFSLSHKKDWSPTVRPPRLGGNRQVGVFASRSPFRPNSLGLSVVKLDKVTHTENEGTILEVLGADLLNDTPIYDVKPYLPLSDCIENASGGYSEEFKNYKLKVEILNNALNNFPKDKLQALIGCLEEDPRPSYQEDEREYGMSFAKYNVKFKVVDSVLYVINCEKEN